MRMSRWQGNRLRKRERRVCRPSYWRRRTKQFEDHGDELDLAFGLKDWFLEEEFAKYAAHRPNIYRCGVSRCSHKNLWCPEQALETDVDGIRGYARLTDTIMSPQAASFRLSLQDLHIDEPAQSQQP